MKLSYVDKPALARSYDPRPAGQPIDLIIIHHGAGSEASDLAILTGKTGVRDRNGRLIYLSSHYYIGETTSYRLLDERFAARHAGAGEGRWANPDPNGRSVGVETKNYGTAIDAWEDVQLARILLCTRDIQRRNRIAGDHIVGHKHTAPTRKSDPAGRPWTEPEWPRFRELVLMDPEPILGDADMLADRFGALLAELESPFAREAAAVFREITGAGIRPSIALAIHAHEGGDMTSIVGKHLNWGAVRTPHDPALAAGTRGGYAVYDDPVKGVRDWAKRILGPKYLGSDLDTVEQVALRYAPFGDSTNSPWAYAIRVQKLAARYGQDVAPEHFYPQTGFAVAPALVAFWLDLGGVGRPGARAWLPGLGMPVSALVASPDGDGQVQWFERGVLGITATNEPRWLLLHEVATWQRP